MCYFREMINNYKNEVLEGIKKEQKRIKNGPKKDQKRTKNDKKRINMVRKGNLTGSDCLHDHQSWKQRRKDLK